MDTCGFLREGKLRWNARRYRPRRVHRRPSIHSTPEEIRAVLATSKRIWAAHAAEAVANAERLRIFLEAQQRPTQMFARIIAEQQRQETQLAEVLQVHRCRARFFAEVNADAYIRASQRAAYLAGGRR